MMKAMLVRQTHTINSLKNYTLLCNKFLECKSSEFECFRESLCLPQSYVCDGVKDCLFSSDEWQCNIGKIEFTLKVLSYQMA